MDLQSPMTFKPSPMQDHVTLELTIIVKIGVKDCEDKEELKGFKKILHERIKTTGAEVEFFGSEVAFRSPYCGSQREKFIFDHSCREKPDADS